MLTRRTQRKIRNGVRFAVTTVTVITQALAAAFFVIFRKSDLMLIRYTRTIQICLAIGLLGFASVVIYAAMHSWPWYADLFGGWQLLRLVIFLGSMLLAERETGYEYVDGRRWR